MLTITPASRLIAVLLLMTSAAVGSAPASGSGEGPDPAAAIPAEALTLAARGFGVRARGGAGGRVLWVTHRGDSGEGSLRAALQAAGPRIVRFKVGGTIELATPIRVTSGRLTVEGLTAAALGGITVTGGVTLHGCNDIVIRHIRFRGGYDPLGVHYCRRVLVDHVSTAWATDENLSTWGSVDVTLQWCIIAEGLVEGGHPKGPHSMGSLQGGGSRRNTTHHTLFTGNRDRNPLISAPGNSRMTGGPYRFDVVNNVIYNYFNGTKIFAGARVNLLANTYRPGPDTATSRPEVMLQASKDRPPRLYREGNRGRGDSETEPPWVHVLEEDEGGARGVRLVEKPLRTPAWARLEPESAEAAYAAVLAHSGAWPRDAEDRRLVDEVRRRQGKVGRVGERWREIHLQHRKKMEAAAGKK